MLKHGGKKEHSEATEMKPKTGRLEISGQVKYTLLVDYMKAVEFI